MWWLLSREVLRLKGIISRDMPWDVMPDLFFYRDPEEVPLTKCCFGVGFIHFQLLGGEGRAG